MTLLESNRDQVEQWLATIQPYARPPDEVLFECYCYVKVAMAILECVREGRKWSWVTAKNSPSLSN